MYFLSFFYVLARKGFLRVLDLFDMPAGGFSGTAPSGVEFEARITPIVIISCIMAATGGLMFGYDVGVSGEISQIRDF